MSRITPKKTKLLVSKFLKFGCSILICKAIEYGIIKYKVKIKTLPISFSAFIPICPLCEL